MSTQVSLQRLRCRLAFGRSASAPPHIVKRQRMIRRARYAPVIHACSRERVVDADERAMYVQLPTNALIGRLHKLGFSPGAERRVHTGRLTEAHCSAHVAAAAISLARRRDGPTGHHKPLD